MQALSSHSGLVYQIAVFSAHNRFARGLSYLTLLRWSKHLHVIAALFKPHTTYSAEARRQIVEVAIAFLETLLKWKQSYSSSLQKWLWNSQSEKFRSKKKTLIACLAQSNVLASDQRCCKFFLPFGTELFHLRRADENCSRFMLALV